MRCGSPNRRRRSTTCERSSPRRRREPRTSSARAKRSRRRWRADPPAVTPSCSWHSTPPGEPRPRAPHWPPNTPGSPPSSSDCTRERRTRSWRVSTPRRSTACERAWRRRKLAPPTSTGPVSSSRRRSSEARRSASSSCDRRSRQPGRPRPRGQRSRRRMRGSATSWSGGVGKRCAPNRFRKRWPTRRPSTPGSRRRWKRPPRSGPSRGGPRRPRRRQKPQSMKPRWAAC